MKINKTPTYIELSFTKDDFIIGVAQPLIKKLKKDIPKQARRFHYPSSTWSIVNTRGTRIVIKEIEEEYKVNTEQGRLCLQTDDFDVTKWLDEIFKFD